MSIFPKTRTGKWSTLSIVAMFLLFVLGRWFFLNIYGSVAAGETIVRDIFARPGLALSMLSGFASGIFAFVSGLVAIIKHKERAILAFISTIIGALLIMFLFAEVIFPH